MKTCHFTACFFILSENIVSLYPEGGISMLSDKKNFFTPDILERMLQDKKAGIYALDTKRVITFWNEGAQKITGYESSEILGLSCMDNILNHIDSKGVRLCEKNCPASRAMQDGLPKRAEIFLHHKNGHRVPVVATVYPVKNYDGTVSGVIEVFNDLSEKDRKSQGPFYDQLTGILCKLAVEQKIRQAEEDFKNSAVSFGLLCFGIDNLFQISQNYTQNTAQRVVLMAANNLSANLRITDETGIWTNDSFMLIVKFVDREQLHDIAQNMLITMNNCFLKEGSEIVMASVSAGGSIFGKDDSFYSITQRVENNLEKARLTDKGSLFID